MSDWDELGDGELDTLAVVETSLPPVSPPDDVLERVVARVQPVAAARHVAVPPRRARLVRAFSLAGAVAALAILVALVFRGSDAAPVDGRAAVGGRSDPAVSGVALLRRTSAAGGTVSISLRDVPPAPPGRHYEVWVQRRGSAVPEAVGAFTPTRSHVELELGLPGQGEYTALDISVEENGGPPGRSDTILASGRFA